MLLVRRLCLWLARVWFVFFLFFTAFVCAVVLIFGTSGQIKQTLKNSGIYDSVVGDILEQANKEQKKKSGEDLPLSNKNIQKAAQTALPPSLIQNLAENGIDGTYSWLEGKTKLPSFKLDLTDAKKDFAVGAANYAENRYRKLPPCTYAQLQTINANDIDIFTVKCQVPYLNIVTEKKKVIREINSNKDFLKDPVLTAEDFPEDKSGKTIFEKAKNVPQAFQWFTVSPWLFGLITLGLGAAVVFLNTERRKGLKNTSIILLVVGGLCVVDVLVLKDVFNRLNASPEIFGGIENAGLKQSVLNIATSLQNAFGRTILIFGIVYLLVGGGILLYLRMKKPAKTKAK